MKQTLIKNVNIYVGDENGTFIPQTSILISDGKIVTISKDIKEEKGMNIIDANGKYIIPGLINMHVHLPASGMNFSSGKDPKKLVNLITKNKCLHFIGRLLNKKYAKMELASGVTSLRTVGGISHFDTQVRDYINNHPTKGSRIFASDYAICTEGGHMAGTVSCPAHSILEAQSMVDELNAHHVDLIKVMITGGVLDATAYGEPGVLKMEPEMVKAICNRAHSYGLKVAAHVESPQGIKVALENGVDTIEHGSYINQQSLDLFVGRNSSLILTFSPAVPIAFLPLEGINISEMAVYNTKFILKAFIEGVKVAKANKIQIGLGNDVGSPLVTHYGFWRELEYYHLYTKSTREEALFRGTLSNARILGQGDKIGSIEVGKTADLIILNENPMDGFKTIDHPYLVMKDGFVIKNTKIKKSQEIDESLNSLFNLNLDEELKDVQI